SKGCLVGSFRSKEGADFPSLIEELGDLPIKSGGHAYAGGITIREEDFDRVNELFLSWASRHPLLKKKDDNPIELDIGEASLDTYIEIRKFGPFGEGHPEPVFLLKDVEVGALMIVKDEKPFKAIPRRGKVTIKSFKFAKEALLNDKVSLKGTFGINEFKDKRTFEFTCEIEKEEN
ncbi:MAG: hypothetical protein II721_02290, partial [Bacilli bacterium]|nr:hypothetical protein [Bacilli bacterium]